MRAGWRLGLAAALLLAACGGGARLVGPAVPVAGSVEAPVRAVRFGDTHPVDWPGHAPTTYPVHGLDVSKYQGVIDWRAARDSGVSFAYIKATEGGDRMDEGFAGHWTAAAAAGVPRGAYHFYYFCTSAEVQARWFIANVPRERGALPPAVDLEWNPQSPTCRTRPAPEVVRAEVRTFLDIVGRAFGQRPVIYTTPDFFATNELVRFAGEEIWLRAVTAHPTDSYGVVGWTFWQYSGTGSVPGVRGPVDLNTFGGSVGDWRAWLAARSL